ncbi:13801_t:CDS:2 [Cetraspora pellucida]|uniref:13801_t:CDS:1 n=1 Tax=Cetraspora pellucida TaxID=1433469 RepID=A0A9N8ZGS7_9GLOM|nr:13801_t:CDS:2 [Cetraspora pellucida]
MNSQQSNDHRIFSNVFEDDNLLTFNNNCLSGSYHMPVNSSLPNRSNQANDRRQVQAQEPDILKLILQEIAAGFKEVTVEVAVTTRPPVHETNLVCGRDKAYDKRTQNQNQPQMQNRIAPQAQPQVHVNHATTPTQILPCPRDVNHISILNKPDKNVNENEAFTAPAAPEIMPTMALSSENLLVTTISIMSTPVMPALAAPILVDFPQFHQTGAYLHADERKLYMQCQSKFVKILMFYEGEIPPAPPAIKKKPEKPKKSDNKDPFDDFEFDNEDLNETEEFLTNQCSKLELYNNL